MTDPMATIQPLYQPPVADMPEVDGAALLNSVHAFLGRFVAYPSEHTHTAHVLWIAHTHLMDAWESTPRIAFLSPEPGSGKTRALEVTELLVPRPVEAINVTPILVANNTVREGGRGDLVAHDPVRGLVEIAGRQVTDPVMGLVIPEY